MCGFPLFIIFEFEWFEVRHALGSSKSHYILFDSHIYILVRASCTADKTTEGNRH